MNNMRGFLHKFQINHIAAKSRLPLARNHSATSVPDLLGKIQVNICLPRQKKPVTFVVKEGSTIVDLANEAEDLKAYIECACGGNAACSTCQVLVDPIYFEKLNPPDEFEIDMLELAYDPQPNSRLGCQLFFTEAMDGIHLSIPEKSNNLF